MLLRITLGRYRVYQICTEGSQPGAFIHAHVVQALREFFLFVPEAGTNLSLIERAGTLVEAVVYKRYVEAAY